MNKQITIYHPFPYELKEYQKGEICPKELKKRTQELIDLYIDMFAQSEAEEELREEKFTPTIEVDYKEYKKVLQKIIDLEKLHRRYEKWKDESDYEYLVKEALSYIKFKIPKKYWNEHSDVFLYMEDIIKLYPDYMATIKTRQPNKINFTP